MVGVRGRVCPRPTTAAIRRAVPRRRRSTTSTAAQRSSRSTRRRRAPRAQRHDESSRRRGTTAAIVTVATAAASNGSAGLSRPSVPVRRKTGTSIRERPLHRVVDHRVREPAEQAAERSGRRDTRRIQRKASITGGHERPDHDDDRPDDDHRRQHRPGEGQRDHPGSRSVFADVSTAMPSRVESKTFVNARPHATSTAPTAARIPSIDDRTRGIAVALTPTTPRSPRD